MSSKLTRYVLPAILLFAVGILAGARFGHLLRGPDSLEQLRKLEDAYVLIDKSYVEDVPSERLVTKAIEAMLKELDPHSSYINKDLVPRVQEGYQGSFGGIGIWFESPPDDTARVTSIIPDGPSEAVGLMPGDRILAVNDSSVIGLISTGIQDLIRGPVGTPVTLSILRRGNRTAMDVVITRGRIPLFSIDGSYMIDDVTGYIRIGRFAMTTHQEFMEHLNRLKGQGMQRLVLDLRDNPGGIKQTAVQVADELLAGGGTVVYTRSRNANEEETDRTTAGGSFETGPVIVLVNENTASGSEIISGAVQDHDRALVLGRRTFGKGLVQRPYQLRDGSIIQLTVSRYYMPSGRLIQTPYENGDMEEYYASKFDDLNDATYRTAEYLEDVPDSLRFSTLHGRTVFGGGGVMPDIVVAPDSTAPMNSRLMRTVVARGLDVLYARQWFLDNEDAMRATWTEGRRQEFVERFRIDDDFMRGFWEYAAKEKLTLADAAGNDSSGVFARSDAERIDPTLRTVMKARVGQRLYRSEIWFPIFNPIDPIVQAAMDHWADAEALEKLGSGPATRPVGGN